MLMKIYYRNREHELVFLTTINAMSLDEAFYRMQAMNWSPNGEAKKLILSKGLRHTSMSIGDVIEANGILWEVEFLGFKRLISSEDNKISYL